MIYSFNGILLNSTKYRLLIPAWDEDITRGESLIPRGKSICLRFRRYRGQDRGYIRASVNRKEHEGPPWGSGNGLHLELGGGHARVKFNWVLSCILVPFIIIKLHLNKKSIKICSKGSSESWGCMQSSHPRGSRVFPTRGRMFLVNVNSTGDMVAPGTNTYRRSSHFCATSRSSSGSQKRTGLLAAELCPKALLVTTQLLT